MTEQKVPKMTSSPSAPSSGTAGRPLDGIKVLAIEHILAGPFCSMWLADAGAEVVKIEAPRSGDIARSNSPTRPDAEGKQQGLSFLRGNRGKKSVTLDLKNPEGLATFLELAVEADIVVENLRPGVMDRLGIGYEALRQLNPRLIYVAISGFGHKDILPSPYLDNPAFDIIGQALSGLMKRPEREGEKPAYLGFSLADIQGGILGAYGAMLALFQRMMTGQGQMVDISLYDSCLILNEISVAMYSAFGTIPKPGLHAVTAPFGSYRTKDGYIVIAVMGEHIWRRLCETIERPDLLADSRFRDGMSRSANNADLTAELEPWLLARTADDAVMELVAASVPASKVHEIDDVFRCPHAAARNMLMTLDDPVWGPIQVAGNPVKMSAVAEVEPRLPPRLGEHNEQVLSGWLGADPARIARLRASGAIGD
ncbi:L-carnitine dehydratase [Sphingobium sp. C100]|uniref:CaiB/BaiF CoA transferase family protein n=1 Tax=Sphingobium sp. C100 TaxID=1207055 RepID=UPI0003D64B1C|nr:CoA transferase [Sphingobium sp. C100]ETI63463.1 L-carnitine dehydratase [Sphingobium sp. C100]